MCEFCLDSLGVSRIWTCQGTFWMACVQTFDSSDIFVSRDRKELIGIKVLFNIGYAGGEQIDLLGAGRQHGWPQGFIRALDVG